jgi:hypothetical protein
MEKRNHMKGSMKLIDPHTGTMQCRVCGFKYNADIRPGGGFYRGAWQCSFEQCPSNRKEWDETKQKFVKPDWRKLKASTVRDRIRGRQESMTVKTPTPWIADSQVHDLLRRLKLLDELENCRKCEAQPGAAHTPGCFAEMCSVCGGQYVLCEHEGHDPQFARWTGLTPGQAECIALGLVSKTCEPPLYLPDLNQFYRLGLHRLFFIKPQPFQHADNATEDQTP